MDLGYGSGIRKNLFRIPDPGPGVKRHRITDSWSWSTTLLRGHIFLFRWTDFLIEICLICYKVLHSMHSPYLKEVGTVCHCSLSPIGTSFWISYPCSDKRAAGPDAQPTGAGSAAERMGAPGPGDAHRGTPYGRSSGHARPTPGKMTSSLLTAN